MAQVDIEKSSRYGFGATLYIHKGKSVISSVGNAKWDASYASLLSQSYNLGSIPPELANRPDLISNVWTGTPYLWWQFLCINNIFDPFESLNSGDPILVPYI